MNTASAAASGRARRPRIAISMGDPFGIGPEVVVKALADPELRARARIVIYGMAGPMRLAAERAGIAPYWRPGRAGADAGEAVVLVELGETDGEWAAGHAEATAAGGEASFRFPFIPLTYGESQGILHTLEVQSRDHHRPPVLQVVPRRRGVP